MNAAEAYKLVYDDMLVWRAERGEHDAIAHAWPRAQSPNLYTQNSAYLAYSMTWHAEPLIHNFLDEIYNHIAGFSTLDVGCESGVTGLSLALMGRPQQVDFHDFPGLGAEFIDWALKRHSLHGVFYPYGVADLPHYGWAIALEVLEHTGNHLATLRWLHELADHVILSYPIDVPYQPPYVAQVDEWVSDDVILATIAMHHAPTMTTLILNGHRFIIW